jgi:hypothetical protein
MFCVTEDKSNTIFLGFHIETLKQSIMGKIVGSFTFYKTLQVGLQVLRPRQVPALENELSVEKEELQYPFYLPSLEKI